MLRKIIREAIEKEVLHDLHEKAKQLREGFLFLIGWTQDLIDVLDEGWRSDEPPGQKWAETCLQASPYRHQILEAFTRWGLRGEIEELIRRRENDKNIH